MPTVKEIATAIEAAAPLCLQESYDNSGLQIGREGNSVDSVLVCLTPTEAIVNEAIERGCNLIVSHHPLLFRGLKRISDATATERIAVQAIRHNISLYAAHTNLDSTAEGVSTDIAQALGMTDVEPLVPTAPGASTGLGTIGEMPAPVPVLEFLRQLQKVFGLHPGLDRVELFVESASGDHLRMEVPTRVDAKNVMLMARVQDLIAGKGIAHVVS